MTFTDEAAEMILAGLRWPDGIPVCPTCQAVGEVYRLEERRQFKCKSCGRHFSVTSGTIFDRHKLPPSLCVQALAAFEESEGAITATALKQQLGITYKTALVLRRRLVEAYLAPGGPLSERPILNVGYWQGFNWYRLNEAGQLVRENHRGEIRVV